VDIKQSIAMLGFFRYLDEEDRERLAEIASLRSYPPDYLLHYERTEMRTLLFLVKGLAKAYKIDKHDNEIFLYHIRQGDLISELSSIEHSSFISYANVIFIEESQVLSVDYMAFKELFLMKGSLCLELTQEVIRQSRQLQDLVNREFIFDAVSKVAMMLVTDLSMFNRLKRYDVSLMLHIQPSTLSRVLNRLKRQGLIAIDHGEVEIVDVQRLRSIYEGMVI